MHLYNVGPTSSTLVQHCTNVIEMLCLLEGGGDPLTPPPGSTTDLLLAGCGIPLDNPIIRWLYGVSEQ